MEPNWEKIKLEVKKIGGTTELATRMNESDSTVRSWFARKNIPLEKIPAFITAIENAITAKEINPGYFGKIEETRTEYRTGQSAPRAIPVLKEDDIGKSANSTTYIYIEETQTRKVSDETFALIANSDIMAPHICKGDIIIIDPAITAQPGDITLAKLETPNRYILAKYKLLGYDNEGNPQISLQPSNSDYPAFEITDKKTGQILGPVIEHRRIVKTEN